MNPASIPSQEECDGIPGALRDLVDGDEDIVRELTDSLLATGVADLAAYQTSCAGRHWNDAGRLAHRMKSTARMARCLSLTQLCEKAEAAARSDDGAEILRLNALLEPGFHRLCSELRSLQQQL